MDHCIVFGCSKHSGKDKGLNFYRISAVVTREGEQAEELSKERRERWILAISRDDLSWKDVLKNERVCGLHFVSGRPAPCWDKYNVDWVPSLNLGKKIYKNNDFKAAEARARRMIERSEKRKALEVQLEEEIAAKRRQLNESGMPIERLDFSESTSASCEEHISEEPLGATNWTELTQEISTQTEGEHSCTTATQGGDERTCTETGTQTDEFQYMFSEAVYRPPDRNYFDSDEKVHFYTGLPAFDTLMVVLEHVAQHVKQRCLSLDVFQELVIVLMKLRLRLNVPLQDLAYRFQVSIPTISRIVSAWLVVMDVRLSPLIAWPERDSLWTDH